MAEPNIATADEKVLVEHFYRELAEERVGCARRRLHAEPAERSLSRSAEAFERATAALQHVLTLAPAGGELAEQLADQAEALVLMAARFEQSADLARRAARGAPSRG